MVWKFSKVAGVLAAVVTAGMLGQVAVGTALAQEATVSAVPSSAAAASSSAAASTATATLSQNREGSTVFDTAPQLETVGDDTETTQLSFYNIEDDNYLGTINDRLQRPALSLSKLYLAYYVFEHGTEIQGELAERMLETSDDVIADALYDLYPDAIDEVAAEFGLESTATYGKRWGYSYTSTYDVVYFIYQLLTEHPDSKVLQAMKNQADVAADGTAQDYGTDQLPGVLGSKFGWSDDLSLHSTVSFGENWIAAVAVTGSADMATDYATFQLTDLVEAAQG